MPKWRNWYTHTTQNRAGQPMRVQVSPSAHIDTYHKEKQIMDIKITNDSQKAYEIARSLPDYFNEGGLKSIEQDTKEHVLYGLYIDNKMIGFVTYKEVNDDVIEMSWLAILTEYQGMKYGKSLVKESLNELSKKYKICKVKTLSNLDGYEPYKKTRAFYIKMGFIPIEIISPYPGWGDNSCQIYIKIL